MLQPVPVAVIQNSRKEILRLRRAKKANNNLQQFVVWAGGHVNDQDSLSQDALKTCLVRELEEELQLQTSPEQLELIGATYMPKDGKSTKHIGIVYLLQIKDVEIVLNPNEHVESSDLFITPKQALKDIQSLEPWSRSIIEGYFFGPP
jgi:predicted NUDIX family phosphoesterase